MTTVLIIFALTYILIASERIDKAAAVFFGTAFVVMFDVAPYTKLLGYIDLNVIYLLVGMMIIVGVLAATGIFEWIAITLAQAAKGNGMMIMVLFLCATALLSAFLDNVTTVILVAPITILVTQILEIPTVPLLILEAIFSNIGGTSTLVGDPPNVIIGSQAGLTFNDFLFNLTPPVAGIAIVTLAILAYWMRKSVRVAEDIKSRVMRAHPDKAIVDAKGLRRALPVFFLVIAGFMTGHYFHLEAGLVAIVGALVMAVVTGQSVHDLLEKVEWATIFFFMGLFMLIGAMEYRGVFEWLGGEVIAATRGNLLATCLAVLWVSAIFSAIVDNIPLVIAMIPLIKHIIPGFAASMGLADPQIVAVEIAEPLYWSLALGACLGGNGSLIGASANVVISQIARRNQYHLSFWDFTRYGFPLMILSVAISSVYICVRYF